MKTIQVIQHTAAEYLGLIEDHLEGRGVGFRYSRPFASGGTLPALGTLRDGLVLLGGGPWGCAGARDLPTLAAEIALARECLQRRWPVVGIGLGAQLLAIAGGGAAEPMPLTFEVAVARRIQPDALGGFLPAEFPIALYRRDRGIAPPNARIIAGFGRGLPAVWQLGENAFGFSGHPGLKVAMVEDLVMEFDEAPDNVAEGLAQLRAVQRELEDALVPIMTGLVQATGWMDPVKGLAAIPVRRLEDPGQPP